MDAERFCEVIKFVVGLVFGGCAGGLIGFTWIDRSSE